MPSIDPGLFHWLLGALELDATVFHLGQYCGHWEASTAGFGRAAFHLILHGRCWLQLESEAPIALGRGDAVFLLRDRPHALTPLMLPPTAALGRRGEMQPIVPTLPDSVGLLCGFFEHKLGISELILSSLPSYLIARADDPELAGLRIVFELIVQETPEPSGASTAMIERLTGVMLLYVIRHLMARDEAAVGLFAAARRAEFVPLLERLIKEPERDWSLAEMAHHAGMSRASFFKHFTQTAGCAPGQFLLALRMRSAARLLQAGNNVDNVAERVGYQSVAAFARAFKKHTGQQPGAYRRARSATA